MQKIRKMTVTVMPFFSKLYTDDQSKELEGKRGHLFRGGFAEQLKLGPGTFLSTFGKAETEEVVRLLLYLCAMNRSIVGVEKEELYRIFTGMHFASQWEVDRLIQHGFLREEIVGGVQVLYPTDLMLERFDK